MFIEPMITWVVPLGFSGCIWLDTKIVLKKEESPASVYFQAAVSVLEDFFLNRR